MIYEISKDRFEYGFTITLELDGGTCAVDSIDVTAGEEIGTLPSAVKGSMICAGWCYDSSFTNKASATDKADARRDRLYPMYVEMTDYTQLTFSIASAGQEAGIYTATKMSDAENIIVDWGDGTVDVFTDSISKAKHAYTQSGRYSVKISDSINEFAPSAEDTSWNTNSGPAYRLVSVDTWSTSITKIPTSAFWNTSITSLLIPSSVTEIGLHPLISCTKLTSITVDANNRVFDSRNGCNAIVRTADDYLVSGCQTTEIPDTVKTIGRGSFYAIPGLGDFSIPEGVEVIEKNAFMLAGITHTTLPSSITKIGTNYQAWDSVFDSSSLQSVDILCPDADWGIYVFMNCQSLTEIEFPEGMTSIPSGTCQNCTYLNKVIIPSTVTSVGNWSLAYCYRLQTMVSYAENAPTVYSSTFASNTSLYAGTPRTIQVPVPDNYAVSYWQSYLVDGKGFTITTIEE